MLPTHGDECGGFFVAVIERTGSPEPHSEAAREAGPRTCVRPAEPTHLSELASFFGLDDSPELPLCQLVEIAPDAGATAATPPVEK